MLAVLVAGLAATASVRTQYYCRIMESVMPRCCCEASAEAPRQRFAAELQRADCCELIPQANGATAPAARDAAAQLPPAPILALLPAVTDLSEPGGSLLADTPQQARAPPSFGPPLFLANCVLLT